MHAAVHSDVAKPKTAF